MSSRPAKRFFTCLTLTACLICLAPSRCAAWGNAGHRIIARIAAKRLNDNVKKAVAQMLGVKANANDLAVADAMAQASTYADEIRPLRPDTANRHFVDMPRSASAYVPARDCVETKQGDCAVAAVERFEKVLADAGAKPEAKAEALKFLIHLIGDLSQPLHCYGDDEGGNLVRVSFYGKQTNLHWVWDTGLIEHAGVIPVLGLRQLTEAVYADKLSNELKKLESGEPAAASRWLTDLESKDPKATISLWAGGTPEAWAVDSHAVAVQDAYGSLPKQGASTRGGNQKGAPAARTNAPGEVFAQSAARQSAARPIYVLNDAYYKPCSKVMERQLMKAGLRLASGLNQIFK